MHRLKSDLEADLMMNKYKELLSIVLASYCCCCISVYRYLGCWKDENLPEMLTSIEGQSSFLDGSYATRTNKLQVS